MICQRCAIFVELGCWVRYGARQPRSCRPFGCYDARIVVRLKETSATTEILRYTTFGLFFFLDDGSP